MKYPYSIQIPYQTSRITLFCSTFNASTARAGTVTVSYYTCLLFNCLPPLAFVGRTFYPPVSTVDPRPVPCLAPEPQARSALRSESSMSTNVIFRPIQLCSQHSSRAPRQSDCPARFHIYMSKTLAPPKVRSGRQADYFAPPVNLLLRPVHWLAWLARLTRSTPTA